jgi:hypothetical protein
LLLCAFPYVLLQWAVVDVWYDRHTAELARPFLRSLLSSVKLGSSIPAAVVLTLPVVAVVIAARSVLSKLLPVERAKLPLVHAGIADAFALQFFLAASTHALCFGAVVLASIAPYLWPTGLLGEPAAVDPVLPAWLPFVWLAGALVSGVVAPVCVLRTLGSISSTLKAAQRFLRLVSVLIVCGSASFLSLYFVYIAQLMYKGTDLLDRRPVEATCRQVVVRVVDNVLTVRPLAATPAAPTSLAQRIDLTLIVSNGSTRTLLFSRELGRLVFSADTNSANSDGGTELAALYLQPAESTVIPPGAVSAIPAAAMLKSSAASVLADNPKLQAAVVEYNFSFVGQTEEFRYHGERPSSQCKASFRAATWVVRHAEGAVPN